MATETTDVHRLSLDAYHRLIESGGLDEDTRIELIDGLMLDMSPKSPEHERAIRWLARRLHEVIDSARHDVGVAAALTTERSEPEPDIMVIERGVDEPYHPSTALLVIEVAVSSQRRDLGVKPRIYARAGVPRYWVVDLDGDRAVVHGSPGPEGYGSVEVLGRDGELAAPELGLGPFALRDVLDAAQRR